MTSIAVILLLFSASAHACWNLMGKRGTPSAAFFLIASAAAVVCCTPILIPYGHVLGQIPPAVWGLLLLTGICQAIYMTGLAGAYRLGHLSVAYPLARATPIVLVAALNLSLGHSHQIGSVALAGMGAVFFGCLMLPMRHFADVDWDNYRRLGTAMALLAAVGTCGYMLIDSEALRELRASPVGAIGKTPLAVLYLLFETLSTCLWLSVYVLLVRGERAYLRQVLSGGVGQAAATGLMINTAYGLVLASMAYVNNVSYVVAFRQISIPIAALLGIVVLKEPRYAPKLAAVIIVFAGVVIVALG